MKIRYAKETYENREHDDFIYRIYENEHCAFYDKVQSKWCEVGHKFDWGCGGGWITIELSEDEAFLELV